MGQVNENTRSTHRAATLLDTPALLLCVLLRPLAFADSYMPTAIFLELHSWSTLSTHFQRTFFNAISRSEKVSKSPLRFDTLIIDC